MANDILIDNTGDLNILNGDFNVGYSDEQHIEHVLLTSKGHYKQNPLIGVGIENYINAPLSLITKQTIEREISLQLKYDKATNIEVSYNNDKLTVSAEYE